MSSVEMLQSTVLRDCGRGIELLAPFTEGDLERAAQRLVSSAAVAIVTGFAVPTPTGPTAETDGPIGAATLAHLLQASAQHAPIITDEINAAACRAAAAAYDLPGDTVCVVDGPGVSELGRRLHEADVETIVFIERLGPNSAGRYLSMRGTDLTDSTVPFEPLLSDVHSIGIGDGGNEIGMGRLPRDAVANAIERGYEIQCVAGTDELILAGVSNWGAWALVGAVAVVDESRASAVSRALSSALFERALEDVVSAGAVDGVTLLNVPSVDGFEREIHLAVLTAVRVLAGVE